MADDWHPRDMVDRSSDRWCQKRVGEPWSRLQRGKDANEMLALCRSLAKHHQARLPQPGSIIASSFTSPIDALYLAAIFDPIFTASYPRTRFVHQISLFQAIVRAFQQPQTAPPTTSKLVDLGTLMKQNPNRIIIVFPECTTTNGRGVLPFSTSLLTTPARTKIFPISLRYTPADITTPLPETYFSFLYSLCSKPTHCIRVRIAQSIEGIASPHIPDKTDDTSSSSETLLGSETGEELNIVNGKMLMQIGSALARLGRSKQVGLGVESKQEFLKVWNKHSR